MSNAALLLECQRSLRLTAAPTLLSITGVVRTLESRGLVTRRSDSADGRLVVVGLTRAGRRTISRLYPVFNAQEALLTSDLTADERRQLAHLLRKVLRRASPPND